MRRVETVCLRSPPGELVAAQFIAAIDPLEPSGGRGSCHVEIRSIVIEAEGRPATDLVDRFSTDDDVILCTVREQEDFRDDWWESHTVRPSLLRRFRRVLGSMGIGRLPRRLVVALLATAAACDDASIPSANSINPVAYAYLDRALRIMEANSIRRYEIDWEPFRARAFEDAASAQRPSETYPAIIAALQRIGDNHSFFRPPGSAASASVVGGAPRGAPSAVDPSVDFLESLVGYVRVPAFSGSGEALHALATNYHRLIESVDTLDACGWIVDLRGNTGGNMWPMVAGVGPILGEGIIGFFVDPDSVVQSWFYGDGSSGIDTYPVATAVDPYLPAPPLPPVAVLTDDRTGSSGESTAIAFRGRADTRSFGTATAGLTTANRNFPLSDGAMIYLAVSTVADRTGHLYGGTVLPDEVVIGSSAQLQAAIAWLQAQQACAESP